MSVPDDPLPAPDPAWAWFLDVDGTLAELAPSPDAAQVDEDLLAQIVQLRAASGGALAFVSGRPIAEVDAMLGVVDNVVAGLHGLERRYIDGRIWRYAVDPEPLRRARDRVASIVAAHPALLLEDKGATIALHYRAAPALASFVHRTMREARRLAGDGFVLQRGKCVLELKPAGSDKGSAVDALMREPPFRDRTPVYLGDDATDEHAFAVVNAMGGHSIKVGRGTTGARWRLPDVSGVRDWLGLLTTTHGQLAAR